MNDVRIRIEEKKNGLYEAHLQMFVGEWFDKPNLCCGTGLSIRSARNDLLNNIRNEINFLSDLEEKAFQCLVIDKNEEPYSTKEILGI